MFTLRGGDQQQMLVKWLRPAADIYNGGNQGRQQGLEPAVGSPAAVGSWLLVCSPEVVQFPPQSVCTAMEAGDSMQVHSSRGQPQCARGVWGHLMGTVLPSCICATAETQVGCWYGSKAPVNIEVGVLEGVWGAQVTAE